MWSDPESANLETVRISTNQDMARRMRWGGLFYALCSSAIILMSPALHMQPYVALFVFVFIILALVRLLISNHILYQKNSDSRLFEHSISTVYILTALVWSAFLIWIFISVDMIDSGAALAILSTVGFMSGGVAAISPRIRLMLVFSVLIYLPGLCGLVLFTTGNMSWVLLAIGTGFFLFSMHNAKLQHDNYWVTRQQAALLEKQAADLELAKLQAESANKAKSDFLAAMSHEIRTPMNGVLGITEILVRTALDSNQKNYLNMIRDSGKTLLRIIDDILDFAKIEANKLVIIKQSFDLRGLIHEIDLLFRVKAKEKKLSFIVDCECDFSGQLIGDSDRIKQILFNLLGNAFKFTHEGEIQLAVRCFPVSGQKTAELQLIVSDSGIGISAENQTRLFQEFLQINEATPQMNGTGLGLAITHNLVSLMGGTITVSSELRKGSQFSVRIPLEYEQAERKTAQLPEPADITLQTVSEHRAHVLVVEDNEVNQLVTKAMLENFHCEVVLACNGAEAIHACSSQHFDLILMDCNMPVMDGFEAARQIRILEQHKHAKPVPIVALTAHAFSHIKQECFDAGMNVHLSKPFDHAQLGSVLDQFSSHDQNTKQFSNRI